MKRLIIALSLICAMHISADSRPIDLVLSAVAPEATNTPRFYIPVECLVELCNLPGCLDESLLAIIDSRIDFLLDENCCACAPTPITKTDFLGSVFTITAPGVYCLAEDVTGVIQIESNNVILDLNGHTIFQVFMPSIRISGFSNVQIKNGLLKGVGDSAGILVTTGSHAIRIENVTITGFENGILLDNVFDIAINETICTGNGVGLQIQNGCQDIDVRTSSFNDNSSGVLVDSSSAIRIQECIANENSGGGFTLQSSNCVQIINSIANGNESGFSVTGPTRSVEIERAAAITMNSSGIVIRDCSACSNIQNGFACSGAANINLYNCFASGNLNGFDIISNCIGLIRGCTATNNKVIPRSKENDDSVRAIALTGFGFFDDGTNAMEYYSNYACDNDTNYSSKIRSAPVSAPELADGVDNIDCSLAPVDECECSSDASSEIQLLPCAALPIFQDDFTSICPLLGSSSMQVMKSCIPHFTGCLLITESGIYCLAENVSGSITIQASNVTLDLNGYAVYGLPNMNGITISNPGTQPLIDVRIHNGLVQGLEVPTGVVPTRNRIASPASTGISIDGTGGPIECIRLEDLTITNWQGGIRAQGLSFPTIVPINQLSIKNVMMKTNANVGLALAFCNDVLVENSFAHNAVSGFNINNCQNVMIAHCATDFNGAGTIMSASILGNIVFNDCQSNNNTVSDGYSIFGISGATFNRCSADSNARIGFEIFASSCLEFNHCEATNNLEGFVGEVVADTLLKNCIACNNNNDISGLGGLHNGFRFDTVTGVCLQDCVAKGHRSSVPDNGAGFRFTNLFSSTFTTAIIRGCTASDNLIGFSDDGTTNAKYYSNVACGNLVSNYLGVFDAPINSGSAAQAFENVDCNLTNPNIGRATLSLAELIEEIVIDIEEDVDATLSIVENISSALDNLSCQCQLSLVEHINSIVEDIAQTTNTTHSLAEHIGDNTDVVVAIEMESASRLEIIESVVERISSLVDSLSLNEPNPCGPTMITEPLIINQPGNYCLANDIIVAGIGIEIAANNVTLDLAGHTITINGPFNGIQIDNGRNNITIKNGFIDGQSSFSSTGIAINPTNSSPGNTGIVIEEITINNCDTGISSSVSVITSDLLINNVKVMSGGSSIGFFASNLTDSVIKNSQCVGARIILDLSSRVRLENCTANDSDVFGVDINGCTCVEIIDCSAQGNGRDGFISEGSSTDIFFKNCYSCNNDIIGTDSAGFNIDGSCDNVYLLDCVAENNNSGDGYGFLIITLSGTLVQGCTATSNLIGFQDFVTGANRFYSNVGCNNFTNFLGVTVAAVASGDAAGAFENVDCGL